MPPEPQPLAGRAARTHHRCPRCGLLLVKGELARPVELHCRRCKRKVLVGGPALRAEGDLSAG